MNGPQTPQTREPHPRRLPFAVLVLAVVGGGVTALLALTTATAASEVRQRSLDSANADLRDRQQQLARDVAAKQAPDQLAREAIRLGLVPAGNPAFIRVNPDGSVTVLGSPAAVTPPPVAPAPTTSSTTPASTTAKSTTKSSAKTARSSGKSTARTTSTATAPSGTTRASSARPSRTPPKPNPTTTVVLPGGPR